jgi:hypothetical protein
MPQAQLVQVDYDPFAPPTQRARSSARQGVARVADAFSSRDMTPREVDTDQRRALLAYRLAAAARLANPEQQVA